METPISIHNHTLSHTWSGLAFVTLCSSGYLIGSPSHVANSSSLPPNIKQSLRNHGFVGSFHTIGTIYRVFNIMVTGLRMISWVEIQLLEPLNKTSPCRRLAEAKVEHRPKWSPFQQAAWDDQRPFPLCPHV